MLAIRDVGSTRLFTRNGYDISRRHEHITERLNELPAERFVLDGELVVLVTVAPISPSSRTNGPPPLVGAGFDPTLSPTGNICFGFTGTQTGLPGLSAEPDELLRRCRARVVQYVL